MNLYAKCYESLNGSKVHWFSPGEIRCQCGKRARTAHKPTLRVVDGGKR